ncbi:MAG: flagellar motor protein MotB [Planctomycetota bacterium]|jgi:chemotaxis protein MotB
MKNGKGQKEPDEAPGAPEWMVTFSDCMTLLLTFFVLLLSFSTFEDKTFSDLRVIYSTYLPSIGLRTRATEEAVSQVQLIRIESEPDQGSEKPTEEKKEAGGLRQTLTIIRSSLFHQVKCSGEMEVLFPAAAVKLCR